MDTIVRATCPNCRMPLRIPTQWIGQIVRCKGCRAIVRSKARSGVDTPAPANGTAESAPLDQTVPNPKAFDFIEPRAARDDDPFPLPEPIAPPQPEADQLGGFGAAPVPVPQPMPAYPYPVPPPGYPYAPPPGYPYPVPPGYPAGAYAPPPGYPYPYAPPPGYPYPVPAYPQPEVVAQPGPEQRRVRTDLHASPINRPPLSQQEEQFIWWRSFFSPAVNHCQRPGVKHLNERRRKNDQAGR